MELEDAKRDSRATSRRHPGVRLLLTLVVLLPMLATGILILSSANSAWTFRQNAEIVAKDATALQVVASARAQMNSLEVPLSAVSYAAQLGISEPVLDTLLHPAVPFSTQLAQGTATIAGFPTYTSTPTLRADVSQLQAMIPKVASQSISFNDVHAFLTKMATDIDNIWYKDYNRLQSDVASWQPPGSFEVHASALRQTYQAFLAGGQEIEGAIFVLEGIGPADSKQVLIQAAGDYQTATSEFAGELSPKAEQAWRHLQTDPSDQHFSATIQQGLTVALTGAKPPFVDNTTFAGASMTPGIHYLSDVNRLVTAASQDLHDTALAQASAASGRLVGELLFLALLALVGFGGVVVGGRVLIRPLKRLAAAALQAHSGDFDLERLPDSGPREVVTTTEAFNDMASTLKAVEAKAVALAAEDLSDPELLIPLPGRTGHALQASVDTLAVRIREREVQRQLLHEAATHDSLTGLLNRAAVFEFLTHDVSRRREAGETVAVLVHRPRRPQTTERHLWARSGRHRHPGHRHGPDAGHRRVRCRRSSRGRRIPGRAVPRPQLQRRHGRGEDPRQRGAVPDPGAGRAGAAGGERGRGAHPMRLGHGPDAAGAAGRRGHVRGEEDGPGHPGPVHLGQQLTPASLLWCPTDTSGLPATRVSGMGAGSGENVSGAVRPRPPRSRPGC